jgi:threonine aldolase
MPPPRWAAMSRPCAPSPSTPANGALGAEAVIFLDTDLAIGSEYVRKQVTQLPSKMRYPSAQLNALLRDDLWISLGRHANAMAARLYESARDLDGVDIGPPPQVNSLFPRLPAAAIEPLREWCFFWDWDPSAHQVRWMTAWDTTDEDVDRFVTGVRAVTTS